MIPVTPPKVKLNRNPAIKNKGVVKNKQLDQIVPNQFNTLIPVGTAIILVTIVK